MEWFTNGLNAFASGFITPITNVFVQDKKLKAVQVKGRVDIAKAKFARKIAKIDADAVQFSQKTKLAEKKVDAYATTDNHIMSMRRNSWLDEIVIMLILAPALFVFVPSAQPYIKKGFAILRILPDFYQALLVLVVVMTVGGVGLIRDLLGKFKS